MSSTLSSPPFPPLSLKFTAETEDVCVRNGDQLLGVVQGLYDPSGLVLDIGCGHGRLAYALHRAGHAGGYVGLDVRADVVAWLQENFTPAEPRFAFRRLDVWNGRYNPKGRISPTDIRIGGLDRPPTLVLALSVFTHMLEADIRSYLQAVCAVMDKSSVFYATFFLLNRDQRTASRFSKAPIALDHSFNGHTRVRDGDHPEGAIGFAEETVRDWIADAGLYVDRTLYGKWCGRPRVDVFQDTLLMRRVPKTWRAVERSDLA